MFNLTASVLVISGGLGFVVLNDLFEFHKRRRLSLQSKLVLSVSGALIGIGALVVFIFEFTNGHTLASLTWPEKIYASIFQSVSTRSSGTSSIDITEMRQATQFSSSCSCLLELPGFYRWRNQDNDVPDHDWSGVCHDSRQ